MPIGPFNAVEGNDVHRHDILVQQPVRAAPHRGEFAGLDEARSYALEYQPVLRRQREVDVGRSAGDRDAVRIRQQDVPRCRPDEEDVRVTYLSLDGSHDVR